MEQKQDLNDEEMSSFFELLIEISALQRLRHVWAEEEVKNTAWWSKFELLNEMIERRCEVRRTKLARFEQEYPEMREFSWMEGMSFDA